MNITHRNLLAVSLVAFGVFCFFKGLPSSVTRDPATVVMPRAVASIGSTSDASPAAAGVKTRAIQDIRVGQRVLAKNPEISNLERRTRREEPEFSNWLQLSLEMPNSDGSTLHIEMLRSEEWLRNQLGFVIGEVSSGERQGVSPPSVIPTANANLAPPSPQTETLQPQSLVLLSPLRPIYSDIAFASVAAEAEGVELLGLTVDLDLPEMGACGTAVITGISTTPEIEQGEGQVVTATFRHPPSNTVLDVVFVDEGTNLDQHGLATAADPAASADVVTAQSTQTETASKPIGVTDNHLFWSEDRGEFIEIGRMEIGERVRTLFGETKIIAQKLPRPGPPAEVYNLEVHEEHVYFVGDDGVLAHNSCDDTVALGLRGHLDSLAGTPYDRLHLVGLSNVDLRQISDGGEFIQTLRGVLTDRAKGVVFSLDGLDFAQVSKQIGRPTVLNRNTTSKELLMVLNMSSSLKARNIPLTFLKNGREVDVLNEIVNSGSFLNRNGVLDAAGTESMLRLLRESR